MGTTVGNVETIWSDVSPTDLAEDIQKSPHIEDLILPYIDPLLAMTVCKKWEYEVVTKPERMRSYTVEFVKTTWRESEGYCELARGKYMRLEDIIENLRGRITAKKCFQFSFADIFKYVRFLYTNHLMVVLSTLKQLEEFVRNIPSWWRESVTMITLSLFCKEIGDYHLTFLKTFVNLHSLRIVLITQTGGEPKKLLPCIKLMSSIRNFRATVPSSDTDDLLEVLCAKSDNLKDLQIPYSFTAKALIKFLENANFSTEVRFDTRNFKTGENGLKIFNAFVRKNAKKLIQLNDNKLYAEFEFRNTKFFIRDECSYD